MTREEAIQILKSMSDISTQGEALDMAIEALSAEPNKAVPQSLADVYKWERDIALSQLEEYGIGFAEKKRDDLVEVVRCKDCLHHGMSVCPMWEGSTTDDYMWCYFGERREK